MTTLTLDQMSESALRKLGLSPGCTHSRKQFEPPARLPVISGPEVFPAVASRAPPSGDEPPDRGRRGYRISST